MKHLSRSLRLALIFFILVSAVQAGCSVIPSLVPSQVGPTPLPVQENGSIQVFFTDPDSPHASDYEGGPDEQLAAAIDSARLSVDVAAYSFNLWSIRNALINASRRGVTVRMVMESDNMDTPEVQDLKDAGIPVIGDQHESLLHDKYIIIDRGEVWTGSMNFTAGGTYRDNNNLLQIRSKSVAESYTRNFESMFISRLFGPDSIPPTPNPTLTNGAQPTEHPTINLGNDMLALYFPPGEPAENFIVRLIGGAQQSIYFMTYAFTSNDIGAAIVERGGKGILVSGVMDGVQVEAGAGSEFDHFRQSGLDVRLDGNKKGLMHHKVIVIDQYMVITGSANFTAAAERENNENVVILFSHALAAKYMEEFARVYGKAYEP